MRLFVSVILLIVSSTAFAATSEKFGKGGWCRDFQSEIERANTSGELFRIRGHCQSNCTLFLGLRNVCVERSATLLFHAGHDRQRNINAGSTQRMLNAYNPALRAYVTERGYMNTRNSTPSRARQSSTSSATGNARGIEVSFFLRRKSAFGDAAVSHALSA